MLLVMELTSDSIALKLHDSYIQRLDRREPMVTQGQNNFRRIRFIFYGVKLIYEYINRQWRGKSRDSEIAGNILNLEREPDLYEPVPAYKWEGLLRDQIFAERSLKWILRWRL